MTHGNMNQVPSLLYFDFNFWKAEVPRLCYFLHGTHYEDKRLTREQQQEMKAKGELPFGQVPVLYIKGRPLTQGTAIIRYVGKQTGLYPKDDFLGAKVDEVLNLIEDLQVTGFPMFREEDPAKKAELQKVLVNETMPSFLNNLEKLLVENAKVYTLGRGLFIVGDHLTVADITAWSILGWFNHKLEGAVTKLIEDGMHPKLKACLKNVTDNEKVKEWSVKYPQHYTEYHAHK